MSDIILELLMHAVRLARSGNYQRLVQVRVALAEAFPDAEPVQISEALQKLADYYMRVEE